MAKESIFSTDDVEYLMRSIKSSSWSFLYRPQFTLIQITLQSESLMKDDRSQISRLSGTGFIGLSDAAEIERRMWLKKCQGP